MLKIKVNKDKIFEFKAEKNLQYINGQPVDIDLSRISDKQFHLIFNNKTYQAEVVQSDQESQLYILKINGKYCEVKVSDLADQLLEKSGLNSGLSNFLNELKAPMPGLILDILAAPGQKVSKGMPLLILEAMKMENIIKATGEGEIKSILVKKGEVVEKNKILIKF
jgi:biotin carboxyl carrier protein